MDFINIFHTVPLKGVALKRDEDGNKYGIAFPHEWRHFTEVRNTENTPVLAAISGTDFIGLDFDTDEGFLEALELDPNCAYVAKSDYKGGHLLYRYQEDTPLSNTKVKDIIDVQMGNSLIYLATEANETKTLLTPPLKALDDLTTMPKAIEMYVRCLILENQLEKAQFSSGSSITGFYVDDMSTLGYLLKTVPQDGSYSEDIMRRLTPHKFRPKYHPDEIPSGEGTEYLQAIRTRLALDTSVNEEMFRQTMHYINGLWTNPMPEDRINRDCDYQIHKALIDGHKAWTFNEHWDKQGLIVKDRFNSAVEFYFDSSNSQVIEHNRTTKEVLIHSDVTKAKNSILSKKKGKVTNNDVITKAEDVKLINDPTKSSYILPHKAPFRPEFNIFIPSDGTQILREPELIQNPKVPEYTLRFLENLIPNEVRRNWFLKFIRHKHLSYDYSPLYLVFAGVGGAGKGVLLDIILTYFSGIERVQEVNLEKLQNNFNAWKATTDYAHLDEAGEGSSKLETAKIVAELKKLTGSAVVSISFKGKDISGKDNSRHYITPILHTNLEVKVITDLPRNDRRFVFIKCPNKLTKISGGDDSKFVEHIKEELPHFAHYLATEVPKISRTDYTSNESQKDTDYKDFMAQTIDPVYSIIDSVQEGDIDTFLTILSDEVYIPNSKVAEMFDTRIQGRDRARILLHNTPAFATLGIPALVDVLKGTETVDTALLRKRLNATKKATTYNDPSGKLYKYHYLEFKAPYKGVSAQSSVEPVSGSDVEL